MKLVNYIFYLLLFLIVVCSCNKTSNNSLSSDESILDSIASNVSKFKGAKNQSSVKKYYLYQTLDYIYSINDDSLRSAYLSKCAPTFLSLNDTTKFLEVSNEALQLAEERGDSLRIAYYHWDMGKYYRDYKINNSEAYQSYFNAEKIFNTIGRDFESGKMLLNMAIIQSNVRDYVGSENTAISAINKFQPLNRQRFLYSAYNTIGIVNNELDDYDNALYYHEKALQSLSKINTPPLKLAVSLNNLGIVYQNKGEYSRAIETFKKGVKIDSLFYKDTKTYATLLDNIAYAQFKNGNLSELPSAFFKAKYIRDSINSYEGILKSNLHLAEYFEEQGDNEKAISFATKSLDIAEDNDFQQELLASLKQLSEVDTNNAFTYTNRYIQISDSLQAQERLIRDKFARIRYETNQYIEENQELSKTIRTVVISLFVVLVLGAFFTIYRMQRQKTERLELENKQQAANEKIYDLMLAQQDKIAEGRKIEKQRISEELHDGILGSLFGARLSLGSLNNKTDDSAKQNRQRYIDRLKEIEEEIRSISHNLRDKVFSEDKIFTNVLQELIDRQSEVGTFECKIVDDVIDWQTVDSKVKMNIYRIIQEALQNINKYAEATKVFLTFSQHDQQLLVSIQDDGKGFDTNKKAKGIGLNNMASRVERLQGEFEILSEIGSGTIINIKVPKPTNFEQQTA